MCRSLPGTGRVVCRGFKSERLGQGLQLAGSGAQGAGRLPEQAGWLLVWMEGGKARGRAGRLQAGVGGA